MIAVAPNPVLAAIRLGWLTVEVFGRLRDVAASSRRPDRPGGNALRRFDFSDRRLNEWDRLFLAADQLHRTAARLDLTLPEPPLPAGENLERLLDSGPDLDVLQGRVDRWSTQVWITLSAEDELFGRAFTYGGSLADTYWHAPVLGLERFAELLRAQRLEYVAVRFDSITGYLPPYTASVLHDTLYRWRKQQAVEQMDLAGRQFILKRLEAQARVWRDLLFGSRSADSYLRTGDRRLISWGAAGATLLLILGVVLLTWLAVLSLSSAGLTVAASMAGLPQQLQPDQAVTAEVINWQVWSVFLATLSSIVTVIIGFIHRLSGWIIRFYNLTGERLKRALISLRAYRA